MPRAVNNVSVSASMIGRYRPDEIKMSLLSEGGFQTAHIPYDWKREARSPLTTPKSSPSYLIFDIIPTDFYPTVRHLHRIICGKRTLLGRRRDYDSGEWKRSVMRGLPPERKQENTLGLEMPDTVGKSKCAPAEFSSNEKEERERRSLGASQLD